MTHFKLFARRKLYMWEVLQLLKMLTIVWTVVISLLQGIIAVWLRICLQIKIYDPIIHFKTL